LVTDAARRSRAIRMSGARAGPRVTIMMKETDTEGLGIRREVPSHVAFFV
jgi:hypothetical protein